MDIQTYTFDKQPVRAVLIDDEPYFVGKDVAELLGYKNVNDALAKHVDEEDKQLIQKSQIAMLENIPNRGLIAINESGLYSLILSSKLPSAKRFKRWVTSEVLPDIRNHGAYLTDEKIEEILLSPDTVIKLAQQLKTEREEKLVEKEKRLIAEQQVNELQPKATYYDLVLQNKSLVSVTQIAKDYGKSARWLNQKLHDLGVQYKQGNTWFVYQKHADKGYTQSTTHVIDDSHSKMFTKWTQKGRLFIYDLLKDHEILPLIEQGKEA